MREITNGNIQDRLHQGTLDMGLLLEPVDLSKYNYIRLHTKDSWGAPGIQSEMDIPDMKFLPLDPPLELTSILVWKGQVPLSPLVKAFIEYLQEQY